VLLINRNGDLGKITAGNHSYAPFVAGIQNLLKARARQMAAYRVVGQLALVAGQDAGSVQIDYGCAEGLQICGKFFGVQIRHINFSEVRLYHTPRRFIPPMYGAFFAVLNCGGHFYVFWHVNTSCCFT